MRNFFKGISDIFRQLFICHQSYAIIICLAAMFIAGYFFGPVFIIAQWLFYIFVAILLADLLWLFRYRHPIALDRMLPVRMSNGDDNEILITVENQTSLPFKIQINDEAPHQFQLRKLVKVINLKANSDTNIIYKLRPTERGEYNFGSTNVFMQSKLGLLERRLRFPSETNVPVYPSFIQMKKYALLAIANLNSNIGITKVRRVGNTMEFDHIRTYVRGDDHRSINWKATARKGELMANQYQDERLQQVCSVIDMGRQMKMPFEQMTLLDYAINTTLALSKVAIDKQDKAGLLTFSRNIHTFIKPDNRLAQMQNIMEALYNQKTDFCEPDYSLLYSTLKRGLQNRSLVVLYTNFESLTGMQRNLDYLRLIARKHLLLIVIFKNTELDKLHNSSPRKLPEIYDSITAEKFAYDKQLIIRELNKFGILTIFTTPKGLTLNTINKYLEIKSLRKV